MSKMREARLVLLSAILLVFAGCTLQSNSGGTNTPVNPPTQGDLTDDEYTSNSQALSMSQSYTNEMIAEMLAGIGRIDQQSGSPSLTPGPSSVFRSSEADSVVITYDENSGYWFMTVRVADTSQGVTMVYEDSIQLRTPSGFVQWPVEIVNQIRAGLRLTAELIDNSPSAPTRFDLDFREEFIMVGDIMTEGLVSVSGIGNFLADVESSDDSTSCAFVIDMAVAMTQLDIDLATIDQTDCPTGGTMATDGTLDWYCTGGGFALDVSGEWEATATYNDGNVVLVVTDGANNWTYNGPCSEL